ncbi:ABC transporter ATP-binding protein [Aneurinibacillus aneurinilyticus]|uniref:ABC transporter ATP-binding protein n=1 Tax=Aneurinibacillus aneurinilyticus TaxID=1391 RepID=UPI002E1B0DFA|nr:ABC transporter ATP-binding protein [Aneurinibacillus aneurinilyticus]
MEYEKPNGATDHREDTKATAVPCRLSVSVSRNTNQTDSTNDIVYDSLILCRPEVDVQAGDIITVVLENGWVREFTAGEPFPYPSHLEIPVTRKDVS